MTIEQIKEQLKNVRLYDGLTFTLTLDSGEQLRIVIRTDEMADNPADNEIYNDIITVFYNLPTVCIENITKIVVGYIDEN